MVCASDLVKRGTMLVFSALFFLSVITEGGQPGKGSRWLKDVYFRIAIFPSGVAELR